ncbi:MAG: hypothetical protein ACRC10_06660 [Thermoguttaceae bacterium]
MNSGQRVSGEHEQIEMRIRGAAQTIKRVDVFFSGVVLLTWIVFYLFLFILLDHWCFPGRLSPFLRTLFLLPGLAGLLWYFFARLFPLLKYPINPVYAARVLEEQREQQMKNTLINWTMIRQEQQERLGQRKGEQTERERGAEIGLNPLQLQMLDGMTVCATRDLQQIPLELNVNHLPLLRWIITLAVLIAVLFFYTLFSPKNPWTSFLRLTLPFAGIDSPSRYRFLDVIPGDAVFFQGETITISARVEGAGQQSVVLIYSTEDQRIVDQVIPMSIPQGANKYECSFPPGQLGLEQGVLYQIGVGTERSRVFRLVVVPPQTFEVRSITYQFPVYTGRQPITVENTGDIRAFEGTEVFLNARSNFEMDRAAFIPNDDERKGRSMLLTDDCFGASTSFVLKMDQKNPTQGEFQTYLLRGYDVEGNVNRQPSVYHIDLLQDQPPTIIWVDSPKENPLRIPYNGFTETILRAEDADFGIRMIRLHLEVAGKQLTPVVLLQADQQQISGFQGAVQVNGLIKPEQLGLQVGDVVQYWGEVVDTRLPDGNRAFTEQLTFVVENPKEGAEKKDADPDRLESSAREKEIQGEKDSEGKPTEREENKETDLSNKEQQDEERTKQSSDNRREDQVNQKNTVDGEKDPGSESESQEREEEKSGREENREGEKGPDADSSNQGESSGNQQGEGQGQENRQKGLNSGTGDEGDQQNQQSDNEGGNSGSDSQNVNRSNSSNGTGGQETGNAGDDSKGQGETGNGLGESRQNGKKNQTAQNNGSSTNSENNGNSEKSTNGENGENGKNEGAENAESHKGSKGSSANQGQGATRAEPANDRSVDGEANPGEVFDRAFQRMRELEKGNRSNQDNTGRLEMSEQSDSLNPDSQRRTNQGSALKSVPTQTSKTGTTDQAQQVYVEREKPENQHQPGKLADPELPILENRDRSKQQGNQQADGTTPDLGLGTERESEVGIGEEQVDSLKRENDFRKGERTDQPGTESVDRERAELALSSSENQEQHNQKGPKGNSAERTESSEKAIGKQQQAVPDVNDRNGGKRGEDTRESGESEKLGETKESGISEVRSEQSDKGAKQTDHGSGQTNKGDESTPRNKREFGGGTGESESPFDDRSEEVSFRSNRSHFGSEQTSLALKFLEEEAAKTEPDSQLLENLGWTKKELRQFVQKWKTASGQPEQINSGFSDETNWREMLNGMQTVRPQKQTTVQSGLENQDRATATGTRRFEPPKNLKEKAKRYNEGIGQ